MKCKKCNTELEENAVFCPNCGTKQVENNYTTDYNSYSMSEYGVIILIFTLIVVVPILFVICNSISNSDDPLGITLGIVAIFIFIVAFIYCKKIKDLVLKVARWLLDFTTTVDVLTGLSILITGIFICKEYSFNYWWFILGAFVYSLLALIKDYALYLLVDIRDSLKVLADNKRNDKEE